MKPKPLFPGCLWLLGFGVLGAGASMIVAWMGASFDRENGKGMDEIEFFLFMIGAMFVGLILGAALGAIVATWRMRGGRN